MIDRLRRALRAQTLPLVAGFGLLAAIVGARSLMIESQRLDNAAVRDAMTMQTDLNALLMLAQDAETGQRGYLLTEERSYLEPYLRATSMLPDLMQRLRDHHGADPEQAAGLDRVASALDAKLAELAEVLRLWESMDRANAIAIVRTDSGKISMDTLREEIAVMARAEGAKLQQRLAAAVRIEDWLRVASLLSLLSVFLLAVYGIVTARQRMTDVVAAQQALSERNAALSREIATREATEAQLRQLQKIEAIGQLTGGIAHDFNNMLAVIMSAMNLAQRKLARGDTDIGKFVEAATDAAERAAKLTARLLAFARQQPLSPQSIEANRLIAGMSDLLRRTLGETIAVETVLAGGLWKTHADASQLENAVLNLAVNARDAMPEGGKLTVETANAHLDDGYASANPGAQPGQYVMIAVSDTGTGMTAEVMAKAFDPFFTTKPVSKGTGLGLSQVFGFVKQTGGHIKIYSEPGEGTTVRIYLPRLVREAETSAPARAIAAEMPAPTETILLVEDDERVRATSAEALRELGYAVVTAGSGAEALERLAAHDEIALLFTDIVMPVMNGRKLADEAAARLPGLKVLFTTGFTRNAVVHNGVLDHGVNFLAKPFTMTQLAAKLREVLDS